MDKTSFIVKTDRAGYSRDTLSKALLSTDNESLNKSRARRKLNQSQQDDINTLKEEMGAIKLLLQEILRSK